MLLNQTVLQKRNPHYYVRQQANWSPGGRADTCLLWRCLTDVCLSQTLHAKMEHSALFSERTIYVRDRKSVV